MMIRIENIHPKIKVELEDLKGIVSRALPQTNEDGPLLNLILTDDTYITNLNYRFTGRNRPTDVLSFPFPAQSLPTEEKIWGEVYISLDRASEQARDYGICFEEEVNRLAIHGILHLLGYDHRTEEEGEMMRKKENQLLGREPL